MELNTEVSKFLEKILFWLYISRLRILSAVIVSVILILLSPLPYFNLILSTHFVLFSAIVISLLFLKVSSGKIILLAIILLLVSLFLYLANQFIQGELIGNYVYGLFFLASMKAIFEK